MSTKIADFLDKYRLKKRLVFFVMALILVPLFLMNIIFYFVYMGFFNSKIEDGYDYIFRESYANLNYKLNLYYTMLERTVFNNNIREKFLETDPLNQLSVYEFSMMVDEEIGNITLGNSMDEVYRFTLYPFDKNMKVLGRYLSNFVNIESEDWSTKSRHIFFDNKMNTNLLCMVQTLYYTDMVESTTRPLALVKVDIKIDDLLANSLNDKKRQLSIEILKKGEQRYIYRALSPNVSKRDTFVRENSLLGDEFTIRYVFDKTPEKRMKNIILLCFTLAAILLSMLLINLTTKFINENYIIETERKKAELLALQMQINPHFMFNTLETINSLAKQSGCDDIGMISRKMGEILRYNINNNDGKFVTLFREIENIKSYLSIQKIRFPNLFEEVYDIPESLNSALMLKFILQPIVENTIKYAFPTDNSSYFLVITAAVDENILTLSVQDDGVGINDDALTQIRQWLAEDMGWNTNKIGLNNVHRRIQLTYGEKYGVEIISHAGIGTRVDIRFPLNYKNKEFSDNEHIDC